jgi:hypothetical protein
MNTDRVTANCTVQTAKCKVLESFMTPEYQSATSASSAVKKDEEGIIGVHRCSSVV